MYTLIHWLVYVLLYSLKIFLLILCVFNIIFKLLSQKHNKIIWHINFEVFNIKQRIPTYLTFFTRNLLPLVGVLSSSKKRILHFFCILLSELAKPLCVIKLRLYRVIPTQFFAFGWLISRYRLYFTNYLLFKIPKTTVNVGNKIE